jgi:proline dehydrogenase
MLRVSCSAHVLQAGECKIDFKRANKYASYLYYLFKFVGGETAEECLELTREMSKNSLGAMLNYSAEVHDKKDHSSSDKEDDPSSKLCIDKVKAIIHLIETSGRFIEAEELTGNAVDRNRDSLMVAVKLSGLIKDASVLERASACLVPRELFSRPPTTTPPSDSSSRGAHASLNIPTASLSKHDVESIKQLWTALQAIATSAKRNGNIRILIDAEHSWYQPAIDALFESCAQQFNAIPASISSWRSLFSTGRESRGLDPDRFHGPLVYNTLQAYLRRTPSYLAMSLERAKQGGYALGVKLVRGAYVEQENKEWSTKIVPTPPSHNDGSSDHLASPVWPNKDLTDQCYNECADLLIREVAKDLHNQSNSKASFARLGLVLAGHNWISNMTAVQTMIDTGLAVDQDKASGLGSTSPPYRNLVLSPSVRGRIHFAQLYGMADDLTRALQQSFDNESGGPGPHLVLKYIPYGDLRLVMPYLIRRAKENKSVMGAGGAQKERSVLAAEMRRRLWP